MLLLRHAARAAIRRPRIAARGELRRPRTVAAHRCLATTPGDDTTTQTPTEGWTANPPEAWMEVMNRPAPKEAIDITP